MPTFHLKSPAWGSLSFTIKDSILRALTIGGKTAPKGKPGRKPKKAGSGRSKGGRKPGNTVKEAVLALIQARKQPTTLAQVKKAVKASGPTIWKALVALVKDGQVVKTGRGVYGVKGAQVAVEAGKAAKKGARSLEKVVGGKAEQKPAKALQRKAKA